MADLKVDFNKCNGCKICYNECPMDVFAWDEEKKKPVVAYPDECWYCGACEIDCPVKAIDLSLSILAW